MRTVENLNNVEAPDGDYLSGRTKDASPAGSRNGTPVNEALLGDIKEFFEKLMREAGITPNDLPDNTSNGFQLYQAFLNQTKTYTNSEIEALYESVTNTNKFTDALLTKLNNLTEGYLGWFADETALNTAHPTGTAGQHATIGSTDTIWAWDTGTVAWVNTDSNSLGDMLKAIYDPTSINGSAFDQDNMTDGVTNKNYTDTEKTKLAGIETGATADQSDAEIETGYNNQVDIVSQVDAEAGTSTVAERWTPERVKQAVDASSSLNPKVITFTVQGSSGTAYITLTKIGNAVFGMYTHDGADLLQYSAVYAGVIPPQFRPIDATMSSIDFMGFVDLNQFVAGSSGGSPTEQVGNIQSARFGINTSGDFTAENVANSATPHQFHYMLEGDGDNLTSLDIIFNDTFSSSLGWILSGTAAISSGTLQLFAVNDEAEHSITSLSGRVFRVIIDITLIPSGSPSELTITVDGATPWVLDKSAIKENKKLSTGIKTSGWYTGAGSGALIIEMTDYTGPFGIEITEVTIEEYTG